MTTLPDSWVMRPKRDPDEHTAAHAGGADHIEPALLAVLQLECDGFLDLRHFRLHEFAVLISFRVVLDEDLEGLLVLVLGDEETWALRQEEDEGDLHARRSHLEQGGILHDQSFMIVCVPNVIPAAMMAPMKKQALKSEVRIGRSLG